MIKALFFDRAFILFQKKETQRRKAAKKYSLYGIISLRLIT